jgi:hypothetical protein
VEDNILTPSLRKYLLDQLKKKTEEELKENKDIYKAIETHTYVLNKYQENKKILDSEKLIEQQIINNFYTQIDQSPNKIFSILIEEMNKYEFTENPLEKNIPKIKEFMTKIELLFLFKKKSALLLPVASIKILKEYYWILEILYIHISRLSENEGYAKAREISNKYAKLDLIISREDLTSFNSIYQSISLRAENHSYNKAWDDLYEKEQKHKKNNTQDIYLNETMNLLIDPKKKEILVNNDIINVFFKNIQSLFFNLELNKNTKHHFQILRENGNHLWGGKHYTDYINILSDTNEKYNLGEMMPPEIAFRRYLLFKDSSSNHSDILLFRDQELTIDYKLNIK